MLSTKKQRALIHKYTYIYMHGDTLDHKLEGYVLLQPNPMYTMSLPSPNNCRENLCSPLRPVFQQFGLHRTNNILLDMKKKKETPYRSPAISRTSILLWIISSSVIKISCSSTLSTPHLIMIIYLPLFLIFLDTFSFSLLQNENLSVLATQKGLKSSKVSKYSEQETWRWTRNLKVTRWNERIFDKNEANNK